MRKLGGNGMRGREVEEVAVELIRGVLERLGNILMYVGGRPL